MKQQLLLLEDVEGLGRSGEVVSVKPGYMRNFLLPQQKAVVAQKHTLRMQKKLQEERAKLALVDKAESEELAKKIEGLSLTTEVKVDQEGNMYGSVGPVDVVAILGKEGITIERKFVLLPRPIRELGPYTINLKLKEGIPASFKLKVLGEGGIEKKKVIKQEEVSVKAAEQEMIKEAEEQAEEAKEE